LDEAMDCERAVAVDACCSYCASSTDEEHETVGYEMTSDNNFKQPHVVERRGQKRTGNMSQPATHVAVGSIFTGAVKAQQNTGVGAEIDGLEPGDEKVVFRSGGWARKRNVNGKIEYMLLDG
jgi:hypothetical protein